MSQNQILNHLRAIESQPRVLKSCLPNILHSATGLPPRSNIQCCTIGTQLIYAVVLGWLQSKAERADSRGGSAEYSIYCWRVVWGWRDYPLVESRSWALRRIFVVSLNMKLKWGSSKRTSIRHLSLDVSRVSICIHGWNGRLVCGLGAPHLALWPLNSLLCLHLPKKTHINWTLCTTINTASYQCQ